MHIDSWGNEEHNPTGLTPKIKIKPALTPVGVDAFVVGSFLIICDLVIIWSFDIMPGCELFGCPYAN